MFTNRMSKLFVAVIVMVVAVLGIRAGIATSAVVSNTEADRRYDLIEQARAERLAGDYSSVSPALDQHERHISAAPIPDWFERQYLSLLRQSPVPAALDQHERHPNLAAATDAGK